MLPVSIGRQLWWLHCGKVQPYSSPFEYPGDKHSTKISYHLEQLELKANLANN